MTTSTEPRDQFADGADPMIDALLAEFVPADPQKRSRPPDLTDRILERLATAESLSDTGDFLANPRSGSHEFDPTGTVPARRPNTASSGIHWGPLATLVLGIAAAVMFAFWFRGQFSNSDSSSEQSSLLAESSNVTGSELSQNAVEAELPNRAELAIRPDRGVPDDDLQDDEFDLELPTPATGSDTSAESIADSNPPRVIPLLVESDQSEIPTHSSSSSADEMTAEPPQRRPAKPLVAIAKETETVARQYWEAVGVEPAPAATFDELQSRLARRLGIRLDEGALNDVARLKQALAERKNAASIAGRWLAQTAEVNDAAMTRSENSELVKQFGDAFAGETSFETTFVSLLDGSDPNSPRFYQTLARGGHEGIAKRLAETAMNADLRCIRCHDSMIGRSGTQEDYWSLVALLRQNLERQDQRWLVKDESTKTDVFYDLPDGRRRLAEPKVSRRLLGTEDDLQEFRQLGDALAESRAFAGSIVDSLWRLVHGRHLVPTPVDALAPPADDNLLRLHATLTDDLLASNFDVARTMALIIASPMTNRTVPDALRVENRVVASEAERAQALELVGAFAAAVESPRSTLSQRIDVAMRRIGGRLLDGEQPSLLAQPLLARPGGPTPKSKRPMEQLELSFRQRLGVDFPGSDAPLPVAWLRSIKDYDQQVQHLVYLSGQRNVPPEIADAAKRLREAGTVESALNRIWWILRD
jgi:hypothetical protein